MCVYIYIYTHTCTHMDFQKQGKEYSLDSCVDELDVDLRDASVYDIYGPLLEGHDIILLRYNVHPDIWHVHLISFFLTGRTIDVHRPHEKVDLVTSNVIFTCIILRLQRVILYTINTLNSPACSAILGSFDFIQIVIPDVVDGIWIQTHQKEVIISAYM